MMTYAIKRLSARAFQIPNIFKGRNGRTAKPQVVVRLGRHEVVAEGVRLNFWADISHRCMTASWPAFIAGAAVVFIAFNAVFALV